ncbi:acyltransferase [Conexibacter sp. SYSU D00693]|uniref:acyltransferase n=1 Tax=Conexibacter sp. SYSU D00693 TaxID=2812560 RepID=UPI00196B89D3|nr:acyltransferase [Conexibacter sp. SYSU D00693]
MLGNVATAVRALRFALWCAALKARLGRHGVRVRVDADGTPRFWTLPAIEPVVQGRGGSLAIRLGRDVKLGRSLVLEVYTGRDNVLDVGDRSTFEAWCRVQLWGGEIVLEHDVHVRDICLLKTKSRLHVGHTSVISRGVHLHATGGIDIGHDCGIGERTSMIDSDHLADGSDTPFLDRPLKIGPIVVGPNTVISANCVLLRGTRVGKNTVVAANAVLNGGEFPDGWLVAGVPASAKRALPGAPAAVR